MKNCNKKLGLIFIGLGILVFSFVNCNKTAKDDESIIGSGGTRTYYMGFTTWPYTATQAGVDYPYIKIATDADMIVYHIEGGVPWSDAENDVLSDPFSARYNTNIVGELEQKFSKKPSANHKVFLATSPINASRNAIANSWTNAGNEQDLAPWNSYTLDSIQVKTAYLNYCKRLIQLFKPDYFAFAIEVNLLEPNTSATPAVWSAYLNLHAHIYTQLKIAYPNLPLFVTQTGQNLLSDYNPSQTTSIAAFNALMEYSDYFAISAYPYLSAYMTNSLPVDFFDRLASLTTKPLAMAEGGYPAVNFTLANGTTFITDATKQNNFVKLALAAADKYNFKFINLWLVRDFDNSWGTSDGTIIFKSLGMYDAAGTPRQALTTWQQKLALTKR